MGALAQALGLPVEELLALQRIAAGAGVAGESLEGPGRPVGQWDPHALEVHPASTAPAGADLMEARVLPGYVEREHDQVLAQVVRTAGQGRSGLVVLVGESSTGKTRACWEAVQALGGLGWRLWHPFDPTRAEAALEELHRVGPRTVVWLNEAQHYLGDGRVGERIAAALHSLLVDPDRGPVLVLGTLWPEYAEEYTVLPLPGATDPHSRVRELLAGRILRLPDAFDAPALAAAKALAENGDQLLADALTRVGTDGRLAQDLGGGPALVERFRTGPPTVRALLEAAMDARRLGVGLHLPQAFLTNAVSDYLHDTDYDQLTDDWAEQAYAYLAKQVHGKQAPLRRINPRPQRRPGPLTPDSTPSPQPAGPVFRLADYLEQHGRTTRRHVCPPASFWHAAHTYLTNHNDLDDLATSAERRHRLQWAHHLRQHAAHLGNTDALRRLAELREKAGDWDGAESLARQAADLGDTDVFCRLARLREESGDRDGAGILYQQAADLGDSFALFRLAELREKVGDEDGAGILYQQAADLGDTRALARLAVLRQKVGDRDGAESLARQAADLGDTRALFRLAELREKVGDEDGAEILYQQTADLGDTDAVARLVELWEEVGDRDGAESLARQAAGHGDTSALIRLGDLWEAAGDWEGAAILYRQAADHGDSVGLLGLAELREKSGDRDGAESLARQATDLGNQDTLVRLAELRQELGDRDGAAGRYRQAADHGDIRALLRLAQLREEDGDWHSAEVLYRQFADHGGSLLARLSPLTRLWPYGLDPDGRPTPRWQ
ncbi:hypothetical protein OIB37_12665 [Streptomyces sp. NBC_00820]|uniref:tetratricopeptide repeat protein n=1 Tax=Streptomyces sp. NBC_00820 TaxID=2975842 RepID=UPI002ED16AE9|nr:hypothetical protein OIB37_12665 [Streptomyces sp. NBC_00820]